MAEEKEPTIRECLIGIQDSLADMSSNMEEFVYLLKVLLHGEDDNDDGIIGKTNSGRASYIRTLVLGG